jgi:hypothetical protein
VARRERRCAGPQHQLAEAAHSADVEHCTEQIQHVQQIAEVAGENQQAQVVQHDDDHAAEEQAEQRRIEHLALDEALLVDQLQRQHHQLAGLQLQIDHRLLAGLQVQREDQVVIDHRPLTDRQRIASDHGLTPSVLPRVVDTQRNAVEHGPLE